LNKLGTKGKKWEWKEEHQLAFEQARAMVAKETMLSFPDFNEVFHIQADASTRQLGGVMSQNNRPLAFYTRQFNDAQCNYHTGEQELLSIVETLKEFRNILMGQRIVIHTDHLNLLYNKEASQRMIRWRQLLEEFGPREIRHVKGVKNLVADGLSRLDMEPKAYDLLPSEDPLPRLEYVNLLTEMESLYPLADADDDDDEVEATFPLLPELVANEQDKCPLIKLALESNDKDEFSLKEVEGHTLVHYRGHIFIPESLQTEVVKWYHIMLRHPGVTRLKATLRQLYWWPTLHRDVKAFCKNCRVCQKCKKSSKKYGKLPAKVAEQNIWNRVNIDLWGPKSIKNRDGQTYKMHLMTMIDPVSGWFECAVIRRNPNSDKIQKIFDDTWLARYPRPSTIGCDGGSEFKLDFKELCENYGMKLKNSGAWNPQANSIVERIHQVMGNMM